VRYGIIHASHKYILLRLKGFEELKNGTYVEFCMGVRFQEAKQEKIILLLSFCKVNCCIGNGQVTDTLVQIDGRPVSREVIEAPGFRELP
jgi:hypothetical protein